MKFSVFQVSRKGGRDKNEDRMGYCYTRESGLFVLADGMGGHPEGEVASQLALQTVSALFQKEAKPSVKDVPGFLSTSMMAAHHQIIRYAGDKGMLDTPRTTLVAAVVQDGCVTCIHCGDSRLYVVRDGELLTRTRDHSYLEQQSAGVIRMDRINRNILFTCLGSPTKPVFDMAGPIQLQQGDRIMLCSDGLWGNLNDADIAFHLSQKTVAQAVPNLVEKALQKGGDSSDNVTVIVVAPLTRPFTSMCRASGCLPSACGGYEVRSQPHFCADTSTTRQPRASSAARTAFIASCSTRLRAAASCENASPSVGASPRSLCRSPMGTTRAPPIAIGVAEAT